jgi:hypothetical protein
VKEPDQKYVGVGPEPPKPFSDPQPRTVREVFQKMREMVPPPTYSQPLFEKKVDLNVDLIVQVWRDPEWCWGFSFAGGNSSDIAVVASGSIWIASWALDVEIRRRG